MYSITFTSFTKNIQNPSKIYIYIYTYLPRAILLGVISLEGAKLGFRVASVGSTTLGLRAGSGVMLWCSTWPLEELDWALETVLLALIMYVISVG